MLSTDLNRRKKALIPGILSALALAGAFFSQYALGMHPCELCLYQRYPYGIILLVSLAVAFRGHSERLVKASLGLCAILFMIEAVIAGYHSGVEWGWFEGLSSCALDSSALSDPAQLRAALMNAPLVSCKDVPFRLLGLSMAGWNVLYALASMVVTIYMIRSIHREER